MHIRNLTPGTEIAFYVPNNSQADGVAVVMSGEKMKVIIVEDEFLAQQELSGLLTPIARWRSSAALTTADVLKFLQHNKVDAIFLDINIPSLDGFCWRKHQPVCP